MRPEGRTTGHERRGTSTIRASEHNRRGRGMTWDECGVWEQVGWTEAAERGGEVAVCTRNAYVDLTVNYITLLCGRSVSNLPRYNA